VIGGGTTIGTNLANGGFMGLFVGSSNGTENLVQQLMPVAGTLSNFFVKVDSNPGGTSITYTVRKNGANSVVTCAIAGGAATSCSDVTHTVAFAAGDLISIGSVKAGGAGNVPTRWTARYQ
jgi:hypothetical protein